MLLTFLPEWCMGIFCLGLDSVAAEPLRGHWGSALWRHLSLSEGNRRMQGNKAETNKWFQEQSRPSLISPAALEGELHSDSPGEQLSPEQFGSVLLAPNTLNNWGWVYQPSTYVFSPSVPSSCKSILRLLTLQCLCIAGVQLIAGGWINKWIDTTEKIQKN